MKFSAAFLFFLFPLIGFGQSPHPILKSFDAIRQPNGILLRWVIKGGNQCEGTKLFRSDDSFQFQQIKHIPGICGSFTENETYSFFDSVPIPNIYNHYKLELGFQGFTDTISAFFEDFGRANHVVLTDHQTNSYRILFSNDQKSEALLQVFDQMGNELYSATGTNSDFSIQPSGWKSGVYIFRITGVPETGIQGKIYFSHQ